MNDSAARVMTGAMGTLVGQENVLGAEWCWVRKSSYMAQAAPGCFLFWACMTPPGPSTTLHRADFRMDEAALPIGAPASLGHQRRALDGRGGPGITANR